METNINILEKFGLNPNDIKVYSSLLKLGRSKTGPIIKDTRIASSRVYSSLRQLVVKGLVSYEVRNNVKYYQAELPHQLIEEAEKDVSTLEELSISLKNFPIINQARNDTNTYEGIRGFKMAYEQHVSGFEHGEVVCIVAFVGSEYTKSRDLRTFFSDVVDRMMIKNKVKGRMITHDEVKKTIRKDRPNSGSLYDIRYLPSKYTLPYTLNISKNEIMMSVWGEFPIVFTIRNPIVIKSFQKNFDYLWNIAKK